MYEMPLKVRKVGFELTLIFMPISLKNAYLELKCQQMSFSLDQSITEKQILNINFVVHFHVVVSIEKIIGQAVTLLCWSVYYKT